MLRNMSSLRWAEDFWKIICTTCREFSFCGFFGKLFFCGRIICTTCWEFNFCKFFGKLYLVALNPPPPNKESNPPAPPSARKKNSFLWPPPAFVRQPNRIDPLDNNLETCTMGTIINEHGRNGHDRAVCKSRVGHMHTHRHVCCDLAGSTRRLLTRPKGICKGAPL